MTPPSPDEDSVDTRIALARMETKLDLVLGQHGTKLDDHEARLRATASSAELAALETDVRVLQDRKTVSPSGLLGAATGIVGLLGGLILILQNINL